jgi:hypothetical protein
VRAILAEFRKRHGSNPVLVNEMYTPREAQFLFWIDRYKRENRRPFPSWCEVLALIDALGYRQLPELSPPPVAVRRPSRRGARRDRG